MKALFDEKIIKENMRKAISAFCRLSVNQGKCSDGDCEFCPVNDAYDMVCEDDDGVEEFE